MSEKWERSSKRGKRSRTSYRHEENSNAQVEKLVEKARDFLRKRDFDRAIKTLKAADALDPNNATVLNVWASALSRRGQHEDALKYFQRARDIEPNNSSGWRDYAITLACLASERGRAGDYQAALPLYDQSLEINPKSKETLRAYAMTVQGRAQELNSRQQHQEAIGLLRKALELKPDDLKLRTTYANTALEAGEIELAMEQCQQCLKIDGKDVPTLNSYGNALAAAGEYHQAFELFKQCLEIDSNNILCLNSYGNALAAAGEYHQAFELFKQSLEIDGNNILCLNSYGNALAAAGEYHQAFELFKQCLEIDGNDIPSLTSYGNALAAAGEYHQAFELFKQSLEIDDNNPPTFTSYGNALAGAGEYHQAFELFKQCLEIDGNNILCLTSYGNALAAAGEYEQAFELFKQCLEIDGNHIPTLNSYGNALAAAGQYEQAFELFEQCLEIDGNNVPTRFAFARWLEHCGEYTRALAQLEAIALSTLAIDRATIVRLYIGRLYYYLKQPDRGKASFEEAIAKSDERDRTLLYAAQSVLVTDPNSHEAIELLQKIEKTSPRYRAAMKAISLHADLETYYRLFGGREPSIHETEMLYRTTYHKIINQVMVLKSIAQRLARRTQNQHPIVQEIIDQLEDLQKNIREQRTAEKATLAQIPHGNYNQVLGTISETAHNIADGVNNQLLVIKSKTRRAQRRLGSDNPQAPLLAKLLAQIELTESALNDLKSIKEKGSKIRHQRFPVGNLFEKWSLMKHKGIIKIDNASIYLKISNPDSEFDGDEEKLKSIIDELIENSLKHNGDLSNLKIRIRSQDVTNPPELSAPSIPGDRRYLKITFKDNGKGVPKAKKDWIFQPLNTTATENNGSGLGLYIVRKTLEGMGGRIQEDGTLGQGVCFRIYLPYLN